jgi:hypothetical protein
LESRYLRQSAVVRPRSHAALAAQADYGNDNNHLFFFWLEVTFITMFTLELAMKFFGFGAWCRVAGLPQPR